MVGRRRDSGQFGRLTLPVYAMRDILTMSGDADGMGSARVRIPEV